VDLVKRLFHKPIPRREVAQETIVGLHVAVGLYAAFNTLRILLRYLNAGIKPTVRAKPNLTSVDTYLSVGMSFG